MKKSRFDRLVQALSSIARKVLAAVPTQELWTAKAINSELRRQGGTTADLRIIQGCLDTLVEMGLIREPQHGCFIAVIPKAATPEQAEPEVAEPEAPAPVSVVVVEEAPVTEEPAVTTGGYEVEALSEDDVEGIDDLDATEESEPWLITFTGDNHKIDREYETYLNLRFERMEKAITVLSDLLDPDVGLALLDVAEAMDRWHEDLLEYQTNLGRPVMHHELKPGWYIHQVYGKTFMTRSEVPPTAEEARVSARPYSELEAALKSDNPPPGLRQFWEENAAYERAVFEKFQPEGDKELPFYDALLAKLQARLPELDVDLSDSNVEQVRERVRVRRGLCDVKVPGVSQAYEYRAWMNLISPGGLEEIAKQGLVVEESWKTSLQAFLNDVGYRPDYRARFVRINPEGNWTADNVQWRVEGEHRHGLDRRPRGWPLGDGHHHKVSRDLRRSSKAAARALERKRC